MSLLITPKTDRRVLLELEWLETNGLGGWAASTVAGAHSRRYHGLLVAATRPPVERKVLLSKLDETLRVGEHRFDLGCNVFGDGTVHPRGHDFLEGFERDLFPCWTFAAGGVRLQRTIAALDGENTTVVSWHVLEAPEPFLLELRPFVAARDYHSLSSGPYRPEREAAWEGDVLRLHAQEPGSNRHHLFFLKADSAEWTPSPSWWLDFRYSIEAERGFDALENLWTPGVLRLPCRAGMRFAVVLSTVHPRGRDGLELLGQERNRRLRVLDAAGAAPRDLVLAADQFVVRRGSGLRTVIAGYHWFGDWGRDTMIALPGLCLATGRFDDARKILRAFAGSTDRGMLPNRFPDGGEAPEYNTVDATLWFFVAIHKFLGSTGDLAFVRDELLPVLRDILDWHERGTRYGIGTDEDGLLRAGEPGVQLTWMDAKIGGWVVTPRYGKPVEVNALWINAIRILGDIENLCGDRRRGSRLRQRADDLTKHFENVYWNEQAGCLYDVLPCLGPGRPGDLDASVRPNQIFALSLPFPLLSRERALSVLERVESSLLTPVGLRSLAPDHPDYRPRYEGNAWSRDSAYHQGTVWTWLLGPYLTALLRVRGEAARQKAWSLWEGMRAQMQEALVGSISEIHDAEPPHAPRGAAAQAWSVAELLRVHQEDLSPNEVEMHRVASNRNSEHGRSAALDRS